MPVGCGWVVWRPHSITAALVRTFETKGALLGKYLFWASNQNSYNFRSHGAWIPIGCPKRVWWTWLEVGAFDRCVAFNCRRNSPTFCSHFLPHPLQTTNYLPTYWAHWRCSRHLVSESLLQIAPGNWFPIPVLKLSDTTMPEMATPASWLSEVSHTFTILPFHVSFYFRLIQALWFPLRETHWLI